ncbi:SUF system Fe-S cluster assembly regulator [Burkholderiaceae bacterium FT117]|uniref:SUF system Fe-S cluster assembly regulator n=1 Tax=Zeimonas sediminis TaxID=2944268 RepID=UPI0023430495|nr:SUF system Fe-S cluster assembly regulator [Zeimonas sediminis]MCM5570143.1 SUF system Fe-S cluster assembly regulator [Zeimonas sediminis]
MLRVSRLTDYGTMVMSHMARSPGQRFSAADLAATLGLGVPTVAKVLKGLARGDLVTSVRGLRGGYVLSRPPEQITVADIVDALEERPFGLTECSATSGLCDIEDGCGIRANWRSISDVVRRALEGVTLADMIRPLPPREVKVDTSSLRSISR